MQLQRGPQALSALSEILANADGLPAVEINPEARKGGRLQLVAVATKNATLLIDASATSGYGAALAAAGPVAGHDAKAIHRALLSAGEQGCDRWACTRLSSLLLAGGRAHAHDLEGITAELGLSEPPPAEQSFAALTLRAVLTGKAIAALIPQIKRDDLGWVSKIEAGAVAAIAEMELAGMCIDAEQWRELNQKAQTEREGLREKLWAIFAPVAGSDLFGSANINLDADLELRQALKALGYNLSNLRRQSIANLPPPLGPLLSRYRELSKIVSAYGESFLEHVAEDGRLHPTFEQIGASTGRMACHSPNLQAVVKDSGFRACFRCAPHRRLVIADYATCELRILAQMSGDPVFREAFARGDDLHSTVASSVFGQPVSKTENPELRQRAKAINFGLVYGMSAAGLGRQLEIDQSQAKKLLDRYFATFPRIGSFLAATAREGLRRGFARTLTGRRLYLETGPDRISRGAAERIAKNMPIQGTSADITKLALARIRAGLWGLPTAILVNAVHDEIVVECDAQDAEAVRDIVTREMEAAGAEVIRDIPLAVDTEIAQTWNK